MHPPGVLGQVVWLSIHWVGGEEGGFKKLQEVGTPLAYPSQPGKGGGCSARACPRAEAGLTAL